MKCLKTACQVFLTIFSLSLSYCLSLFMCLICLFPMIQARSVVLKKRKLGDALFFIGPERLCVTKNPLYLCICLINIHKLNLEMPKQHAAQWLTAVRCTSEGLDLFLDAEICSHLPPGFIVIAVWGTILRITVSVFSELAVRGSLYLAQGCFDQLFKWLVSIQSDSVPALQIYLEILSLVVPLFSVFAENGLITSLIQRHNGKLWRWKEQWEGDNSAISENVKLIECPALWVSEKR